MKLRVNGVVHTVSDSPDRSLLSVLRDDLGLTGSKFGCGEGQCGACTVLLGDQPVRSCITSLGSVASAPVTTIEGLEHGDQLHPVQQAFIEEEALQCGYCTSGMIMSSVGLLRKNSQPSSEQIVRYMQGNVCRCGTYPRIVAAIRRASELMKA